MRRVPRKLNYEQELEEPLPHGQAGADRSQSRAKSSRGGLLSRQGQAGEDSQMRGNEQGFARVVDPDEH